MADISKVKLPDGSVYNLKDANARTNYVSKTDELLTTNNFAPPSKRGPYISKIDNAFYAADKRWTITATNTGGSISNLFDGSYESTISVASGKTAIITMDFSESTYFPGYPYGYILVSVYYTALPASITCRAYCNYEPHGIGWFDIPMNAVSDSSASQTVYRGRQGKYNISKIEFTIVGQANGSYSTLINQIEMHLDRPDSSRSPFVSKYANETLYYNLTAPKFIGTLEGTSTNVTGTVAIANGGTGKTTANDAANALISSLPDWTANPNDATKLIRRDNSNTATFGQVTFSTVWEYIKGKISSVLGLTNTNYGGTSAKATADASGNTITSYYAPKSTAVTNVALSTNKITKTINGTTTDVVTAATTSTYGITKLSTSTSSTATDLAATPSAVKTAYDLANTANGTANTALSGVNGTLIYDHTYTISNGVATFVPHVYQKGVEVTSNYAASCFTWKYRLDNNVTGTPSYVNLTTDSTTKGCTVTISTLGYGGHVIGTFTPT